MKKDKIISKKLWKNYEWNQKQNIKFVTLILICLKRQKINGTNFWIDLLKR